MDRKKAAEAAAKKTVDEKKAAEASAKKAAEEKAAAEAAAKKDAEEKAAAEAAAAAAAKKETEEKEDVDRKRSGTPADYSLQSVTRVARSHGPATTKIGYGQNRRGTFAGKSVTFTAGGAGTCNRQAGAS